MTQLYQARFITIEGTEGVGKTTNIAFIVQYLRAKGITLVQTREPGGTALGEALRALLLADHGVPMTPEAELLMVFAARAQHLKEVIKPALEAGQWVLSDRFIDASYAYQGGGRQIPMERIESLEAWLLGNFKADHTLLLDAPITVGRERQQSRAEADRFEKEADLFFDRVRAVYLERAKDKQRYTTIDATQSLDEVQSELKRCLDKLLEDASR